MKNPGPHWLTRRLSHEMTWEDPDAQGMKEGFKLVGDILETSTADGDCFLRLATTTSS